MKTTHLGLIAFFSLGSICVAAEPAATSADLALLSLRQGNERFVTEHSDHAHLTARRRGEVAKGQHPFATILACSDSRLPVEAIFDQGFGDLFMVRVIGNVAKADEIASVEYGAVHLETPVVVVMGHTSCGAVTAAVEHAEVHGSIPQVLAAIEPAVAQARAAHPEAPASELVARSVESNVWHAIGNLFTGSAQLRERAKAGQLKVVGAVYNIESGVVQWQGEHPDLARLLAIADERPHGEKQPAMPPVAHEAKH